MTPLTLATLPHFHFISVLGCICTYMYLYIDSFCTYLSVPVLMGLPIYRQQLKTTVYFLFVWLFSSMMSLFTFHLCFRVPTFHFLLSMTTSLYLISLLLNTLVNSTKILTFFKLFWLNNFQVKRLHQVEQKLSQRISLSPFVLWLA